MGALSVCRALSSMPGNSGANWLKAEVVMLGVGWGDREPLEIFEWGELIFNLYPPV